MHNSKSILDCTFNLIKEEEETKKKSNASSKAAGVVAAGIAIPTAIAGYTAYKTGKAVHRTGKKLYNKFRRR
jgi:hypothetical protein